MRSGILAQIQPKLRKGVAQHRHQPWQQERPDGWDHAKPKRPTHRRTRRFRCLHDRLQRGQRGARTRDQIAAERREHHVLAGAPVKDRGVELPLQRQDAGGKRGLGYRTGQCRTAEMPAFCQCGQIAELLWAG